MSDQKPLAEHICQGIYKRSADPKAPENALDADWQAGYFLGKMMEKDPDITSDKHPITEEWRRRSKPTTDNDPRWKNWKAGYWAGRFSRTLERR